jgi:hypothetical protein
MLWCRASSPFWPMRMFTVPCLRAMLPLVLCEAQGTWERVPRLYPGETPLQLLRFLQKRGERPRAAVGLLHVRIQKTLLHAPSSPWVPTNLAVVQVALSDTSREHGGASDAHMLILVADGRVFSMGSGKRGCLGHGDQADIWSCPRHVEGLAEAAARVATGPGRSAAIICSGELWTWGGGACGARETHYTGSPAVEVHDDSTPRWLRCAEQALDVALGGNAHDHGQPERSGVCVRGEWVRRAGTGRHQPGRHQPGRHQPGRHQLCTQHDAGNPGTPGRGSHTRREGRCWNALLISSPRSNCTYCILNRPPQIPPQGDHVRPWPFRPKREVAFQLDEWSRSEPRLILPSRGVGP